MHTYLREIEDAVRNGGPLRELLRTHINPVDFNSGLVAALIYPQQAHLGGNGTAFDAREPNPAGVRYATEHFAQRVSGDTLHERMNSSRRFLSKRPSCYVPRATMLIGIIAANHPENEADRRRLYGTAPDDASYELAVKLDKSLDRLTARIGSAYVDGRELHPLEFVPVTTPNGVQ